MMASELVRMCQAMIKQAGDIEVHWLGSAKPNPDGSHHARTLPLMTGALATQGEEIILLYLDSIPDGCEGMPRLGPASPRKGNA